MDDATIPATERLETSVPPKAHSTVTDLSSLMFIRTTYAAYDAGGGKPSAAHASRSVSGKIRRFIGRPSCVPRRQARASAAIDDISRICRTGKRTLVAQRPKLSGISCFAPVRSSSGRSARSSS